MSLSDLITYWFPDSNYQDFWFDGSKDYDIREKFNQLLKDKEKNLPDISTLSNDEIFQYIILFDQITRNISRIESTIGICDVYKRNDPFALKLSQTLIDTNSDISFPINRRIFILLPYRHSRSTQNLDFVIDRLKYYKTIEKSNKQYDSLHKRFFMATLKDYSKVDDTIEIMSDYVDIQHPPYNSIIHDDICKSFTYFPNVDAVNIEKNLLYKSVERYVNERGIKNIGISLSGGVDSNVLMYILYQLRIRKKLDTIIAIHINYNNREVSDTEAKYLYGVCMYFNIPMVTRKIMHMTRTDDETIDRTFYEEETKKIRFGVYKYAQKKFGIYGICLGHHKDDMTENVFMNLMRGKDLLDLYVMAPFLINDGVNVMRPMLNHNKKEIYDIAHEFKIMYFKDTTPDWSFRGTIRRKIFPAIESFDPLMLTNLGNVGKRSLEWKDVIETTSISPLLKTLYVGKTGFSLLFENGFSKLSYVFWSRLLSQAFHSRQYKMVSHKNLHTFINWTNAPSDTKCSLSNGLVAYREKANSTKLYFFKSGIRCHDNENITFIYDNSTDINEIIVSNWKISLIPTTERIETTMSYDDLLKGHFCYTEPVSDTKLMQIGYHINEKDRTKRIFRKISKFSEYVPKCTSGHTDFVPIGFVKIILEYTK